MAEIVRMPALSDTMEEGTLVAWHKEVGDAVESGELLAEIETDKAVMEFQSFFDGTLLYIGLEEGASIAVDAIIAIIGEEGEDYQALLEEGDSTTEEVAVAEPVQETVTTTAPKEEKAGATNKDTSGRVKASPLAKSMAKEEGVDLNEVNGSGDDGRIVKRDIEDYLANRATAPAVTATAPIAVAEPTGDYEDVSLSQMRRTGKTTDRY
jgi:pyruvate dehydrogenase E2 component (dihydrolipoamide acetyltransferase)